MSPAGHGSPATGSRGVLHVWVTDSTTEFRGESHPHELPCRRYKGSGLTKNFNPEKSLQGECC